MALKSFEKTSDRDKGYLIGQYFKLINYYNQFFPIRTRVYLKSVAEKDGSLYWLQGDHKKFLAGILLDPNYKFSVDGLEFATIGHTISTRPGTIHKILEHVLNDHQNSNLLAFSKPLIAKSVGLLDRGFVEIVGDKLGSIWPSLADINTNYFNLKKETIGAGLIRQNLSLFLRLAESSKEVLKNQNPDLFNLLNP